MLEKCGFSYLDTGLDLLPARGGLHPCDRFQLDRKTWALSRSSRHLPSMPHQTHDASEVLIRNTQQPRAEALVLGGAGRSALDLE